MKLPAKLGGVVTRYEGNGRRLGYPTANIDVQTDLADGVYFGHASLGDYVDQPALLFVGTPTTMGSQRRRVEAHLLDVENRDYYGERLDAVFEHFHRPNERFESVEALLAAMRSDEHAGRKWLQT